MLNKVNLFTSIIDRIRLPFRKDKELYSALYHIIGFYPHKISYYKLALMHKSVYTRGKGRTANNERLEFLGDAILDAAVGDIVYRHFPGKREGFLTNTRSKLVQRDTLGKLAQKLGLPELIRSTGHTSTHNSYMAGNAFEALVGAIYLDRGYDACMTFLKKRILKEMINIDKVAYKEVNFKSKLLEWCQKNKVSISFELVEAGKDDKGSPTFCYRARIEGIEGCSGNGFSKKESQQRASKDTLQRLRREPQFIDEIFAAKAERTRMEETPVEALPQTEQPEDFIVGDEPATTSDGATYADSAASTYGTESIDSAASTSSATPSEPKPTAPAQPEVYTETDSLVESTAELQREIRQETAPETGAAADLEPTDSEASPAKSGMTDEEIIEAAERAAFEEAQEA